MTQASAPGSLVKETPRGTTIEPTGKGGVGGNLRWRGEWKDDAVYSENDIVIRGSANEESASWNDTDNILANTTGKQAGTFRARRSVEAGQPAPGEPDSSENWETLARFATHLFVVKLPGSVPQSAMRPGSVSASESTVAAEISAASPDAKLRADGLDGRSIVLDTAACVLGGSPQVVSITAIRDCEPTDEPGSLYMRLIPCSPRVRIL